MWMCLEETCLELSSLSLLKDIMSVLCIVLIILIIVTGIDRYHLNQIRIIKRYHAINLASLIVYGVSLIIVTIGVVIVIRKRKKLFYIITIAMLTVSCAEIGLSVIGYINARNYNQQINEYVEEVLMEAIENYERDPEMKNGLDYIQTDWHCCGVAKNSLWKIIPPSCCRKSESPNNCTLNYERSCMPPLSEYLREKLLGIGVINTVLLLIDVLTGFWAFIIAKQRH